MDNLFSHIMKTERCEMIMRKNKLAVVGATGLVGKTILKILEEKKLLKLFCYCCLCLPF